MEGRMISDEDYENTQLWIGLTCAFIERGGDRLDDFIERAERSMALGPIPHPSEFQVGAERLGEVLAHAHALRRARNAIIIAHD
jgi:hypothetical protein